MQDRNLPGQPLLVPLPLTSRSFMSDNDIETVTIPKAEYDQLIEDSLFLDELYAAGVDNWQPGYDIAKANMVEVD